MTSIYYVMSRKRKCFFFEWQNAFVEVLLKYRTDYDHYLIFPFFISFTQWSTALAVMAI